MTTLRRHPVSTLAACAPRRACRPPARAAGRAAARASTRGSVELDDAGRRDAALRPGRRADAGISRARSAALARLATSPRDVLKGGDVGVRREPTWTAAGTRRTSPQLLTVLAANQPALERAFYGRWWPRALLRLQALAQRQHAAPGAPQHRRALRPRQRLLPAVARPDDDLLVGAVRRRLRRRSLAAAQQAKYDAHARRARAAAGRAHPRDRLRLGRLRRDRGARRLPRHRHSRCPTRRPRTRASASPRAGLADRVDAARCRTTATCAAPTTASRRSRCSRRSASATGPRTSAPARRAARPAAAPASRRSPSPTTASSATARSPTSSSSTSFPAACSPRRRASSTRRSAAGLALARRARVRPRLRGDARSAGSRRSTRNAAGDPRAGLRRALHPLLALLPRLLRRRLRHAGPPMSRSTRSSRA